MIPNHCRLHADQLGALLIQGKSEVAMAGDQYEVGVDLYFLEDRCEQDRAVYAIRLRRADGLIQETHMLGHNLLCPGRGGDRGIGDSFTLQRRPDGVDLVQDVLLGALVTME